MKLDAQEREIVVPTDAGGLPGMLWRPADCRGTVVFAHGSGSSRRSPRNQAVARWLVERGCATLLFDLLTEAEGRDRRLVFDIDLLARRVGDATRWLQGCDAVAGAPIGYFGASTGAAAALVAAAGFGDRIAAVVSRGGRPDLAGPALPEVTAPTLLIVGGLDREVLALNRSAQAKLTCSSRLVIIEGATHLFEEPGTLEQAAAAAASWFVECFEARPA